MGQALGDKTIYSIMVSFAIVALSSWGAPLNIDLGVSVGKLGYLCAIGALAGLFAGGGERLFQYRLATKRLRRKLNPEENYDLVLEKLLERNAGWNRPKVTLRLKKENNEAYIGSLYGKTDTDYVLVGWFEIEVAVGNRKVESLEKTHEKAKIVSWARKNKVPIKQSRPIRKRIGEAEAQETENYVMSWKNEEVSGVSVEFEQALEPFAIKGTGP